MALTVHEDMLDSTGVVIENGAITSLTRGYIIEDAAEPTFQGTWEDLYRSAMDETPEFGTYPGTFRELRLVKKTVQSNPQSSGIAQVVCDYVRYGYDDREFIFTLDGSLTSVESEKDGAGAQIELSHTWPGTDPDYPGDTQTQGGQISVQLPVMVLRAKGILTTDYPIAVEKMWLGAVNAFTWASGAPGTWMCTGCKGDPHQVGFAEAGQNQWVFSFEFTHCLANWQPLAFFTDDRNGKPAPGLVPNVGIKQILWYPQLDYRAFFKDW